MSTPQPPYGSPEQIPPAPHVQTPAHGVSAPGAQYLPPQGAPQTPPPSVPPQQRSRPGSVMPILALVFAIVGLIVVCLGYAAFVPGVGIVLGGISFSGWLFLIAGLVLAIVALARRAAAKGVSIAALIVSIVGGLAGIGAAIVFVAASIFGFAGTMVDEYGDLVPENPNDYFEMPEGGDGSDGSGAPEGSQDADVQADCEVLLGAAPEAMEGSADLSRLFDRLSAEMKTEAVREPLEDLADAYEDLLDMNDPDDAFEATEEHRAAAAELDRVCGFGIGQLP